MISFGLRVENLVGTAHRISQGTGNSLEKEAKGRESERIQ